MENARQKINDPAFALADHLGMTIERGSDKRYYLCWKSAGCRIGPTFSNLNEMDYFLEGFREGLREGRNN